MTQCFVFQPVFAGWVQVVRCRQFEKMGTQIFAMIVESANVGVEGFEQNLKRGIGQGRRACGHCCLSLVISDPAGGALETHFRCETSFPEMVVIDFHFLYGMSVPGMIGNEDQCLIVMTAPRTDAALVLGYPHDFDPVGES